MASDVMAPVPEADICSPGGKLRLVVEGLPVDDAISREADLIAMIAEPAPSVKYKRTLAPTLHIAEVYIVQVECRIHSFDIGPSPLLPVEPPEVYAIFFIWVKQDIEIVLSEFFICDYKEYKRVNHFEYIPLPGGDKVADEPWRTAVSYLYKYFIF